MYKVTFHLIKQFTFVHTLFFFNHTKTLSSWWSELQGFKASCQSRQNNKKEEKYSKWFHLVFWFLAFVFFFAQETEKISNRWVVITNNKCLTLDIADVSGCEHQCICLFHDFVKELRLQNKLKYLCCQAVHSEYLSSSSLVVWKVQETSFCTNLRWRGMSS